MCAERAKNKGQRKLHPTLQSLLMQRYDNLLEVGFKHDKALHPHENIGNIPLKSRRKPIFSNPQRVSSAKKQGHNILNALTLSFQGHPLDLVGAE